jgi:hypothetical protein
VQRSVMHRAITDKMFPRQADIVQLADVEALVR